MPRQAFPLVFSLIALQYLASVDLHAADAVGEAKARLKAQAAYLASDELEGRGVGTEGLAVASKFLRTEFAQLGLGVDRVAGDAYQTFELITGAKLGETNTLELVDPEGKTTVLHMGPDFEVCSFAGAGSFEGELAFTGYGIDEGEGKYNDFAGIDVKGKVVIILRRNPRQAASKGHGISRNAELRAKLSQAHQHGAAAVLFVNDPYSVKEKAESRAAGLAKAAGEVAGLADADARRPRRHG
jgi:hypothetical protein